MTVDGAPSGTTHSFVNWVWRSHGLKPHLIRTFKLSNDLRFEEQLQDAVGLYLDLLPENAADSGKGGGRSVHASSRPVS